MTTALVAQVATEALVTSSPRLQLSQLATEALVTTNPALQLAQVVVEVLVPNDPGLLGTATLSASGSVAWPPEIRLATVSRTLGALTASASGMVLVQADLGPRGRGATPNLGALTGSAGGLLGLTANVAATLAETVAAGGKVLVQANGALQTGPLGISATGLGELRVFFGAGLGALTASASGAVKVNGRVTNNTGGREPDPIYRVGPVTVSAAARSGVTANFARTLTDTVSGGGSVLVQANASGKLGALALGAGAGTRVNAAVNGVLGALRLVGPSSALIEVHARLEQTSGGRLGALTLTATSGLRAVRPRTLLVMAAPRRSFAPRQRVRTFFVGPSDRRSTVEC